MNILFFHTHGIIPTGGGISRTTAILGQVFREQGHKVWYMGIFRKDQQTTYDNNQLFLPVECANSNDNITFLCNFIRDNHIDFIINQAPFTVTIVDLLYKCKKKTPIKVISCYHNSILTPIKRYAYCQELRLKQKGLGLLFYLMRKKWISKSLEAIYIARWRKTFRQTVEKSDAIVLLCDGQTIEFLQMCGYKENSKVYVIPNSIPLISSGNIEKNKIAMWTGTFDYSIKRPDMMLQIWRKVMDKHPEWFLYMLGDGPSLSDMKKLTEDLKIRNVVFTGRVNPDSYYHKAMIQCMTSIHEAFPMVSVEAMAHNIPVMAFNSFTSAEVIIKDQLTGWLIEPFDIDTYAKKLDYMMNNINVCLSMGKKAKQSLARFSKEEVYRLWVNLFFSLNKS